MVEGWKYSVQIPKVSKRKVEYTTGFLKPSRVFCHVGEGLWFSIGEWSGIKVSFLIVLVLGSPSPTVLLLDVEDKAQVCQRREIIFFFI